MIGYFIAGAVVLLVGVIIGAAIAQVGNPNNRKDSN